MLPAHVPVQTILSAIDLLHPEPESDDDSEQNESDSDSEEGSEVTKLSIKTR